MKTDKIFIDDSFLFDIFQENEATKAGFRPDQLRGSDGRWIDEGRRKEYNYHTISKDKQLSEDELIAKQRKRAKELLEVMRKNPEGFSYQIELEIIPTKGYMVAPSKDTELRIPVGEGELEDVTNFILDNWDALQEPGNYAGGWIDSKANEYVLDVSVNVMDRLEAIKIGIKGKQTAVWDVELYEEIFMEDYELRGGKVYARKQK